jgi:hypothetical protein
MLAQRIARLYFAAALSGSKADTDKFRTEFKSAKALKTQTNVSAPAMMA